MITRKSIYVPGTISGSVYEVHAPMPPRHFKSAYAGGSRSPLPATYIRLGPPPAAKFPSVQRFRLRYNRNQ